MPVSTVSTLPNSSAFSLSLLPIALKYFALSLGNILEKNDIQNFLKVYELFVQHKDIEEFHKINSKTLVITGEGDVGSTPEMSKKLSNVIKNSILKIVPGKHLCSIECPDDVNNEIRKLING